MRRRLSTTSQQAMLAAATGLAERGTTPFVAPFIVYWEVFPPFPRFFLPHGSHRDAASGTLMRAFDAPSYLVSARTTSVIVPGACRDLRRRDAPRRVAVMPGRCAGNGSRVLSVHPYLAYILFGPENNSQCRAPVFENAHSCRRCPSHEYVPSHERGGQR